MKVLVWNENRHEKTDPRVTEIYPGGQIPLNVKYHDLYYTTSITQIVIKIYRNENSNY